MSLSLSRKEFTLNSKSQDTTNHLSIQPTSLLSTLLIGSGREAIREKENININNSLLTIDLESNSVSPSSSVNSLSHRLGLIFNQCQSSSSFNPSHLKECQKLYKSTNNAAEFFKSFYVQIDRVLIVWKKEFAVDRVIEFICLVVSKLTENNAFNAEISFTLMSHLINRSVCVERSIRYRSIQLLSLLLSQMSSDAELSEPLFLQLREALIIRTKDKQPLIRAMAVRALERLQDNQEPEENKEVAKDEESDNSHGPSSSNTSDDEVRLTLLHLLSSDPSVEVRKSCLKVIDLSNLSGELRSNYLMRIRDIHPVIRKLTYICLIDKVPYSILTLQQRTSIMRSGLNERDETVRRSAGRLLKHWLSLFNNNIHLLLSTLGVEYFDKECKLILNYCFDNNYSVDTPLPPYQSADLTKEKAFYWSALMEYKNNDISASNNSNDTYLPDLTQLIECLSFHLNNTFIIQQLLNLLLFVDINIDESGRKALLNYLLDLMKNVETDEILLDSIHKLIRDKLFKQDKIYFQIMENDIIAPLYIQYENSLEYDKNVLNNSDDEISSYSSRLELLEAELSDYQNQKKIHLLREEYQQAAIIKYEIEETNKKLVNVKKSIQLLQVPNVYNYRILQIALLITKYYNPTGRNLIYSSSNSQHQLPSFMIEIFRLSVIPSLNHPNIDFRCLSFNLLGLICQWNKEIYSTLGYSVIIKSILSDVKGVTITCIQALVDNILIYGDIINPNRSQGSDDERKSSEIDDSKSSNMIQNENYNLPFVLNHLSSYLSLLYSADSCDRELCCICIESLCKLLLFNVINHSDELLISLLTHLFLIFFDDNYIHYLSIHQCLSVFFPSFISLDGNNSGIHGKNRSLITYCLLPVITVLIEAKQEKRINKIIQYFIFILEDSSKQPNQQINDNIDNNNCNELSSPHYLAEELICQCLTSPHSNLTKHVLATLNYLSFPLNNSSAERHIKFLMKKLREISNKTTEKMVKNRSRKIIEMWENLSQNITLDKNMTNQNISDPLLPESTVIQEVKWLKRFEERSSEIKQLMEDPEIDHHKKKLNKKEKKKKKDIILFDDIEEEEEEEEDDDEEEEDERSEEEEEKDDEKEGEAEESDKEDEQEQEDGIEEEEADRTPSPVDNSVESSSSNSLLKVKFSPVSSASTSVSEVFEVEDILYYRIQGRGKLYFVKWKGFSSTSNTWENSKSLLKYGSSKQQLDNIPNKENYQNKISKVH